MSLVGSEICKILGYGNPSEILKRIDSDEKIKASVFLTLGLKSDQVMISEIGVFKLLITSQKPGAKLFQKWLTDLLLPSFRKGRSLSQNLGLLPENVESYFIKRKILRDELNLLKSENADNKAKTRLNNVRIKEIYSELDKLDEIDQSQLKLEL